MRLPVEGCVTNIRAPQLAWGFGQDLDEQLVVTLRSREMVLDKGSAGLRKA